MKTFKEFLNESDCVPNAIEFLLSNDQVKKLCSLHGHTERDGMKLLNALRMVHSIGINVKARTDLMKKSDGTKFMLGELFLYLNDNNIKGSFVIAITGHVIGWKKGKSIGSGKGRYNKEVVTSVWEIDTDKPHLPTLKILGVDK